MNAQEALTEVDRLQAEIEAVRPIDAEQEARVFQKLRLEWNFNSNAIEGNSLTFGETRAFLLHGLTARGKPFKDYLDIRGHDEVIDLLIDFVRRKADLTESDIRELHKILLVEPYEVEAVTPEGARTKRRIEIGKYKTAPNHVLTSTGETHFFASPQETPARMAELIEWYRRARHGIDIHIHPVVLATEFHHRFVSIHPFDDGNGRMARILMNLILMQSGYLPVVLKAERRPEYFLALQEADAGEVEGFIIFVAEAVIDSADIYLRAARGEPIDELDDFDKKLRLLRQAVETEAGAGGDQRTLARQDFLVRGMLSSLFASIADRFANIDPLFSAHDLHITYKIDGKPGIAKGKPIRQLMEQIALDSSSRLLSEIQLFYHARGFVKDAAKDFLVSLVIHFRPEAFLITFQATGVAQHELFRGDYSSFPDEPDGQRVAKTALTELLSAIEKVAGNKSL